MPEIPGVDELVATGRGLSFFDGKGHSVGFYPTKEGLMLRSISVTIPDIAAPDALAECAMIPVSRDELLALQAFITEMVERT